MERLSRIIGAYTQEIRKKVQIRLLEGFVGMGTQAPMPLLQQQPTRKAVGQWGTRGQVVSGEESEGDLQEARRRQPAATVQKDKQIQTMRRGTIQCAKHWPHFLASTWLGYRVLRALKI